MHALNPLGAGLALALTAAIVYLVCTLAFLLWPSGTLAFFSAWFHGIDLSTMKDTGDALMIGWFIYGLCGIVVAALLVGLVYAWINNIVRRLFVGAPR